jgi:hypothetical protein
MRMYSRMRSNKNTNTRRKVIVSEISAGGITFLKKKPGLCLEIQRKLKPDMYLLILRYSSSSSAVLLPELNNRKNT